MNPIPLYPKYPFSLHWSAIIFSNHDPMVRTYSNHAFSFTALLSNGPFVLTVNQTEPFEKSPLTLSIWSDKGVRAKDTCEASDLITWYFALNDNLMDFLDAICSDPVMKNLAHRLYGLRSPATPTVFEALIDSVIEQQISLSVARSLEYRFIRQFGRTCFVNGDLHYCYPLPEDLAGLEPSDFRRCGFTSRKGEYIRDISRSIEKGNLDLESFKKVRDNADIVEALCQIRGIGRWTAELTMLRGLHRMDAFPADDIALRRMISRWYHNGKKISASEALKTAEQWGEYKGLASFYLEVAEYCGIIPGVRSI